MRVMAIDYGDAHIGIATSDVSRSIIGDAWIIDERNMDAAAARIAAECSAREVDTIVLGLPRNMDGSEGPRAEKSRVFAAKLESAASLPVVLWDERRTTVDAHRILSENDRRGKKRKARIDAVAASLILEGYLGSL